MMFFKRECQLRILKAFKFDFNSILDYIYNEFRSNGSFNLYETLYVCNALETFLVESKLMWKLETNSREFCNCREEISIFFLFSIISAARYSRVFLISTSFFCN